MESESKTSDEILEELFSALNVPLSPKTKKGVDTPPEKPDNSGESEGSDNKEADSKSSETEEDTKGQEEKMAKNHKHKTSKKKKEKKKKKKKHKKKDDDGRHKSKKKHKRDSVIQLEENASEIITEVAVSKAEEVVGKLSAVVQEQSDKSYDYHWEMVQIDMLKSLSRKAEEESSKSLISHTTKLKSDTGSDSGSKEEPLKKLSKKLNSPQRSHSSSKSARSRSRSTSRTRQHRHSRSRSRSRSRHLRHSRSRSESRSKHITRQSRSRSSSRTKSSSTYKSKAKSPHGSDKVKRKRKSRSRSKSLSPKRSKKQRVSRFHSRSISPKKSKRRSSRSYSKSISPKLSRKKRYSRSRSLSPSKISSKERSSRSRSGSHKRSSHQREKNSSLINRVPENSSLFKLETSKDQKTIINIDLSMIPTPAIKKQLGCPSSALPISLENIPLPIPPVSSSEVSDPSSIPLPQPVISSKPQAMGTGIDVGTIPVPVAAVETSVKEQEPAKSTDTGSEKGKAKMIIIKSLKDSLIYMQAQEEAERRAKVKQDDQEEPTQEKEKLDENIKKEKDHHQEEEEEDEEKEEEEEEEVGEGESEEEAEVGEGEEEEEEEEEEQQQQELVQEKENVDKDEDKKIENVELVTDKGNEDDGLNGMEEGEIASEDEVEEEVKTNTHKKKSKKDKDKNKEKKKNKKDKSKEKKRRSREKSKSKERTNRSRSKSKERSKHKRSSRSWHKYRDVDRRYKRYSRSRSRSRNRFSRFRHRSYSRSRSRSRSRSGRKRDCVSDLRDKVTRKRLLEIARRNAVYLMQNGCLPPSVEQEQLVKIKTGGKSVEELTDFCKQLVATGNYSDVELSDPSLSSDEDNDNPDKPFSYTRHPFSVRDSKPILMNIRNAPMLPTKTNAERLADHAKLREQFPVSSGSQHRTKGEVKTCTEIEKLRTADSGWVPVSPKEKKPKEEDSVFSKEEPPAVDISQIVSSRISAMRKLQDNPHDMEALKTLHNVQKEMQSWALSKQEPGQFTGSTGVKILSQEELCAGQQAWVRKEQFKEAAPVRPHFGLKMLQKMGWTPGEGLGKNKDGDIEPLLLDVKMDKKGFHAQEELTPKKPPIPMAKDLSARKCNKPHSGAHSGIGKHPVSALVELCAKRKWQLPEFDMVFDYGPDHKKNFLMKVRVNGQEYKPAVAGLTKKLAKANAAAACLQSLGLFPNDPFFPLTESA